MGAIALGVGVGVLILYAFLRSDSKEPEKKESKEDDSKDEAESEQELEKDIKDVVKDVEKEKQNRLNLENINSPLYGVDNKAWREYVRKSVSAKTNFISKGYNLGMFLFGMRTLEDFGYAKDVEKQPNGIWTGIWVPPNTLEGFLSNPKLQYEVFVKLSTNHYNVILKRHSDYKNKTIEFQTPTLSGLLGVAKQAGLSGLSKWLSDIDTRKPATTKAFLKFNGIF